MAQPLDDRIASALKPGSRLADCETLLSDVRAEVERVTALQTSAEDRRSDPTTNEADAAEANLEYEEAKLRLIRLARAETALGEAIVRKKADEADRALRNKYGQVQSRCEKLAAELTERVAPMIDELADILARLDRNNREIAEVNRNRPEGCQKLVGAEVLARGEFAGHFAAQKLVEMKLPLFAHNGLAWPTTGDAKAAAIRAEKSRERVVQANADREASKARYLISVGDGRMSFPAAITAEGMLPVRGTIEADCYPNQVELNRQKGLLVEPWTEEGAAKAAAGTSAFAEATL